MNFEISEWRGDEIDMLYAELPSVSEVNDEWLEWSVVQQAAKFIDVHELLLQVETVCCIFLLLIAPPNR